MAEILDRIVRVVRQHGGVIDPSARFVDVDGDFGVHALGSTSVLMRVPHSLLIPVSSGHWALSGDTIEVDADGTLSDPQRLALDLMVEYYNAAGKMRWYRSRHPRGALDPIGPVAQALKTLRPRWTVDPSVTGFLRTRTFNFMPAGTNTPLPSLMPVIDLLNHHSDAPAYHAQPEALEVGAWRVPGSDECRVRYRGHGDPLTLALQYGFVDTTSPYAFSAPVTVEVDRLGPLSVSGHAPRGAAGKAFPTVESGATGITLSHLLVDARRPAQARAAVRLPVLAVCRQRGIPPSPAERIADEAVALVADRNRQLLEALQQVASQEGSGAAMVVADAAARQQRLLDTLLIP